MITAQRFSLLLLVTSLLVGCFGEQATLRRGYRHFRRGQYSAAIRAFDRVIENNPSNVAAWFYRGFCYSDLRDYDKAISDWKKCVELQPDFIEAYVNLGNIYWQINETNNTIKHLSYAIELKPNWKALTNAYRMRCIIYYNLGDYKNSLSDCAKLVELVPNDFGFFNNYAYFLSVCPDSNYRNGKEGIQLAKKAMGLAKKTGSDFQQAVIMDTLAAAHAENGNFEQAVEIQKQSIELERRLGKTNDLEESEERLRFYENDKPWRDEKM